MSKWSKSPIKSLCRFLVLSAAFFPTYQAYAGGFGIREQSTSALGAAFAGSAASEDLSGMYWNPAMTAAKNGMNSETHLTGLLFDAEMTAKSGSTFLGFGESSGQFGHDAVVGASYFNYQISPNLYVGLALNSPFGLATEPDNERWAGATHARTSKIFSLNANPTIAYKIAPGITIGAGVQIQYIDVKLKQALVAPVGPTGVVEGDDYGVGFTAGVTLNPYAGTQIGVGFRSSIDHTLEGEVTTPLFNYGVTADLKTPEIVTVSLRQDLTPSTTLLGTFEWSNWSRLEALNIQPKTIGAASTINLGWEDGWLVSAGLEHRYDQHLTLRTGIAYEHAPIQEPEQRTPRLPDSDRIWLSVGASYKLSPNATIDLAYSHIFFDGGEIDRIENGARLLADVENSTDIIGVSFKYKWD